MTKTNTNAILAAVLVCCLATSAAVTAADQPNTAPTASATRKSAVRGFGSDQPNHVTTPSVEQRDNAGGGVVKVSPVDVGGGAPNPPLIRPRPSVAEVGRMFTPLNDDELLALKTRLSNQKRALAAEVGVPDKPSGGEQLVDLKSTAQPPLVRVSRGRITYIYFLDAAGMPWPVEEDGLRVPPEKCAVVDSLAGDPFVVLTAKSEFQNCNIGVRLAGLPIPITVQVVSGQAVTDYRVDLRIPRNQSGTISVGEQLSVYDDAMQALLDLGSYPGAKELKTDAPRQVEAWLLPDKRLIVRTRAGSTVIGWTHRVAGSDGSTVYALTAAPVVLVRDGASSLSKVITIDLPSTL